MKKNNKKVYKTPKLEVIVIKKEEIIVTSGGVNLLSGLFGDGKGGVNVG